MSVKAKARAGTWRWQPQKSLASSPNQRLHGRVLFFVSFCCGSIFCVTSVSFAWFVGVHCFLPPPLPPPPTRTNMDNPGVGTTAPFLVSFVWLFVLHCFRCCVRFQSTSRDTPHTHTHTHPPKHTGSKERERDTQTQTLPLVKSSGHTDTETQRHTHTDRRSRTQSSTGHTEREETQRQTASPILMSSWMAASGLRYCVLLYRHP